MRLATFIEEENASIIAEAVAFARTLGVFTEGDESALRNHFPGLIRDIAADMRRGQSESESIAKSHGEGAVHPDSDAGSHGRQRARAGLQIEQVIAEYRAMRSSVLRLWSRHSPSERSFPEDVGRFNEAVDQAIADSVNAFSKDVERRRQIFLAALGHDLRGPLQAMLMTSDAVVKKCPSDLLAYANILQRSAGRMADMLESLLDYNLVGLGGSMQIKRAHAVLKEECAEEVSILRAALPTTTIDYVCEGECSGIYDASRIREALSNLIMNASKYGRAGHAISVSVCSTTDGVAIKVTNVVEQAIPEDTLRRLFDPLRRGVDTQHSECRSSLGLGLFITKEIVEAHGGSVFATSAATTITFTLHLPRHRETSSPCN